MMFTSMKIVKLLGCRRISRFIWNNSAPKYSSLHGEKNRSRLLNYHSRKCLLVLKYERTKYKHSLHRPLRWSVGGTGVFENISHRPYQTKSKDFSKEEECDSDIENKTKSILDDLEFQNILKDFSQDFEVNEVAGKILEEIRETHETPLVNDIEKPPCETTCANHQVSSKTGSLHSPEGLTDNSSSRGTYTQETEDDSASEDFFHVDQELERSVEYDSKRGKTGVYDIGDLVTVLREENLFDISVIQVPDCFRYSDYLVLATAKSPRHCNAIMEIIIKLYKKKKNKKDRFVKWEGDKVTPWKSLDMGNIILHVFLDDTRNFYDIESLWLLDKKYDNVGSVKSDPEMDIMQQHLDFLNTLNPQQ